MSVLMLTAVLAAASFGAGLIGALTGLGGGVVIVPLLVVGLGVDIRYAIGASLVSVIATSSGAAAAFLREGYSNVRVAMLLEIATTSGALSGAFLATVVPASTLAVVFGFVLLGSAWLSHDERETTAATSGRAPAWLRLDGVYPTAAGPTAYRVRRVPGGFALMYAAGVLSGLLGIGSGAVKVLAMDTVMQLPFKVSAATSNFMIGVTAAASAGVYLRRGYIDPGLAMPVMLGVLAGALVGARILDRARSRRLRRLFMGVIVVLAIEMLYAGMTGKLE